MGRRRKAQAQGPADEREIAAGKLRQRSRQRKIKLRMPQRKPLRRGTGNGIEDVAAEVPTKARANDIPQPAGQAMPETSGTAGAGSGTAGNGICFGSSGKSPGK